MNCTLRTAQTADFVAVASWISDARTCVRWAGPRLAFPFSSADLQRSLSSAGTQSYCLADGPAAACGFGQHWVLTPGAAHLGRIIVSPTLRGQGLGRLLCRQLMARALQQTGASALTLRVFRDNAAAVALYSSLGFAAIESESTAEILFMTARPGPGAGGRPA